MTPEELAEIEARLTAATPGPWRLELSDNATPYVTHGAGVYDIDELDHRVVVLPAETVQRFNSMRNADLIAHAPADIARLLAEVRRLTPAAKAASNPASTIHECRTCANAVIGWDDGTVSWRGWRRIERIDGPNLMCPECVERGGTSWLREDWPSAYLGAAVEVRDAE